MAEHPYDDEDDDGDYVLVRGRLERRVTTLDEARTKIKVGMWTKEGISCPCCGQFVKVYKRGSRSLFCVSGT